MQIYPESWAWKHITLSDKKTDELTVTGLPVYELKKRSMCEKAGFRLDYEIYYSKTEDGLRHYIRETDRRKVLPDEQLTMLINNY